MRARWVGLLAVGAAAAGCDVGGDRPPPAPLSTDGPNQVVVFVPTMT